jgi:hypothetical protein
VKVVNAWTLRIYAASSSRLTALRCRSQSNATMTGRTWHVAVGASSFWPRTINLIVADTAN